MRSIPADTFLGVIGGYVDGMPTSRGNYLQRVRELLRKEAVLTLVTSELSSAFGDMECGDAPEEIERCFDLIEKHAPIHKHSQTCDQADAYLSLWDDDEASPHPGDAEAGG